MAQRLVVIGGVAAGMSAAAKAKRTSRNLEAVVYERGRYISYAACGMPYLIAGDIRDPHKLILRTPEQMAKQGVEVHVRHEVTAIDPDRRTVTVTDLEDGAEFTQRYDKLVLATGASPVHPPLPGSDLPGIFSLRTLESGLAMQQFLSEHLPESAIIIGGGYVGLEMAESLRRLGLEVALVIRSGKALRASTDDDLHELVHRELDQHGVKVIQSTPVNFEGKRRLEALVTEAGRHTCDIALLGMGARPNVSLAEASGVATGRTGAIATDDRMRTNLPGVYAAGDCAEALHLVTGEPAYLPLGSTANKQGRVAGENAAGGQAYFGGVVGTTVVRCFDLVVATTGLTTAKAQAAGFDVKGTMIQAHDISHYFPGAAKIYVKLIVDRRSDRLLGGQIAGKRGVAKRIDVLAAALHNQMTVRGLRHLDLSYAPPFAPSWDPILVAANVASK